MKLFNKLFFFLKGNYLSLHENDISQFILYRIVDSKRKNEFILQCMNAKSTFKASISELAHDLDILYGLHPIQACFVGIEYAFYIKKNDLDLFIGNRNSGNSPSYGKYKIKYLNRKGLFCFIDTVTHEEYIADARELSFSKDIIEKFHAADAFYIGLNAGFKLYADNFSEKAHSNVVFLKQSTI